MTERRRTERRLRAILDRIDEAIFLARAHEIPRASQDPDYVSAGYEEIWGQPLGNIRDRYEEGFFGTLHPDDEAAYRAFVEDIVADIDRGDAADRYSTEYRIEQPDGTVRWVQSDYYPVEWAGDPPRIVIVSRDVTDRKERERRLASFEAATDDLTTVDAPDEAARTAVEAAVDSLDLSAVGVFLYDDERGVLAPAAHSPALPDGLATRPISPSDGPLWEAFATGTVAGSGRRDPAGTPPDADPDWGRDLADWREFPLGNHGVLFVGSAEASLVPDTLQSTHVLAATLEAALNHLRGQRELASREARLRSETERAERLDRIARLTQRVEAAITEGSDPAEVERAVCESLVDTGPYELAWIGGVAVGTNRLGARTVAGESGGYVDALELEVGDATADRHPAVAAWETDAVRVAGSLVDEGPAGDWRQRALAGGYQSLCAVPLTYDGITHGVLTIAAGTPNAFGERFRTRIERLERDANEEMEHVLDLLEYQNLERIWLERVQSERQQGRGTIEDNGFTLHVVRTADSGAAYEDTIDHLSESEREITGLVFALAGYLAHDVAVDVPFMVLDSMEAFDSDRIATIVEHFSQHAPYLVVALLPEDAAALPDESTHIEHPAP